MESSAARRAVALATALALLSLVVRAWNAPLVPGFRGDEVGEVYRAYKIYLGEAYPLTNNAPFIGALYNYLIASVFLCVGPSLEAARYVSVVFGSFTVGAAVVFTYMLFGLEAAFVAGLLLALSPGHVLVASHVAWSASLAPFFAISSSIAFLEALRRDQKWLWLLFGLLTGLGLQAHPSTSVVVLFAPALYALFTKQVKRVVSAKRLGFALLGLCVGYSNMILYNIVQPLGSLYAMTHAGWTGLSHPLTPQTYVRRFVFIVVEFFSLLCAGVPIVSIPYLLKHVETYAYLVVLVATAICCTKLRGEAAFAPLVLIVGFLVLPVATLGRASLGLWGFAWGPHYIQMLLPYTYALVSYFLVAALRKLWMGASGKAVAVALLAIFAWCVVLWPFTNLLQFYRLCFSRHINNAPILELSDAVGALASEGDMVYVDPLCFQAVLVYRVCEIENPSVCVATNTQFIKLMRQYGPRYVAQHFAEIYLPDEVLSELSEFSGEKQLLVVYSPPSPLFPQGNRGRELFEKLLFKKFPNTEILYEVGFEDVVVYRVCLLRA